MTKLTSGCLAGIMFTKLIILVQFVSTITCAKYHKSTTEAEGKVISFADIWS